MLKDTNTIHLVEYLDTLLRKNFENVFVRKFPIYLRYTIKEDMLAVIWFKKGVVELGAFKVKNPSNWNSDLQDSKYAGLRFTRIIDSEIEGINAIKDILLPNDIDK